MKVVESTRTLSIQEFLGRALKFPFHLGTDFDVYPYAYYVMKRTGLFTSSVVASVVRRAGVDGLVLHRVQDRKYVEDLLTKYEQHSGEETLLEIEYEGKKTW